MYSSIAIDDLNDDSVLDLAVVYIYVAGPSPHPSYISVIFQDPLRPGTFFSAVDYAVGNDAYSIAIGDLNDDGLPDLVAANAKSNNISILFQDLARPGNFLSAKNFATGSYPGHIGIGDLNGDNLSDLVVTDDYLSVFLQNPIIPGTFFPRTSLGITGTSCVAVGDLDGDSLPDLAVTKPDADAVSIVLQDPITPGEFLPAMNFVAGLQPLFVAIGDLDGNLLSDLAVANLGAPDKPSNASASVLLQNPTIPGHFLAPTNYATAHRSREVAIEDLNGDSLPDFVVANGGSFTQTGTISVLLQDPSTPGAFFQAINYVVFFQPVSVAIGDLNEDTLPDIAVADEGAAILFQDSTDPGNFLIPIIVGN